MSDGWDIPAHWLRAMQALGKLAAHDQCSRDDWEQQVRAFASWIPRPQVGDTVAFLLWIAEQFQRQEENRLVAERGRLRRCLWPLAATQAPLAQLLARAHGVAGDGLRPAEIDAVVDEVLVSAEDRWRRGVL